MLGLREGATENTAVVCSLLSELLERGVDFPFRGRISWTKALTAAVRKRAGTPAFLQRCPVHKKRKVVDHLPEQYKADVKRKLQNAYAMVPVDNVRKGTIEHEKHRASPW